MTGSTTFIENEYSPTDAQTVGSTWQYVNKDGGPDRRFNSNRQLPIMNYGVCEFKSVSGLNILLHVSSRLAVDSFGHLYKQCAATTTPPTVQQSGSRPQTPPHKQHQATQPPQPPRQPTWNCCQVLGLTLTCTREEASARYRELAKAYHPDRVTNLAPEFQALAHQKMTEINN